MNSDSGLSLMTMRDATEFETDNEQKFERQTSFRTSKNKNADTDSDDAFVEVNYQTNKCSFLIQMINV